MDTVVRTVLAGFALVCFWYAYTLFVKIRTFDAVVTDRLCSGTDCSVEASFDIKGVSYERQFKTYGLQNPTIVKMHYVHPNHQKSVQCCSHYTVVGSFAVASVALVLVAYYQ